MNFDLIELEHYLTMNTNVNDIVLLRTPAMFVKGNELEEDLLIKSKTKSRQSRLFFCSFTEFLMKNFCEKYLSYVH